MHSTIEWANVGNPTKAVATAAKMMPVAMLSVAARVNCGIAVLAAAASIAVSGAAFAQSSLPVPDAAPPTTPAPATAASAWEAPEPWRTDRFYLATSVYTKHFFYNPAHNNQQHLIQGEWNMTEQWLVGASVFDNSFGQPTQYVYGGYRFRPLEELQPLYRKVTAGLVHGYTGQYQNKIPFNNAGTAPVITRRLAIA